MQIDVYSFSVGYWSGVVAGWIGAALAIFIEQRRTPPTRPT